MLVLALGCAKSVSFEIDLPLFEHAEPAAPVDPFTWDVGLFDDRPSAYLPAFLEVDDYGATLLAEAILRRDGEGFLTVAVDELVVDVDGPLVIEVTVSSADGRRYLLSPGADVRAPPACTLTVDATTAPDAHAADLLACLRAWTDANGGPVDLFVEIAATTDDDDWSYAAGWTFGADRPVIARCTGPQVADGELGDGAEVELHALALAGYAASLQQPLAAAAFAGTWPSPDALAGSGGSVGLRVGASEGAFVGQAVPVVDPVPAEITFRDEPAPVITFPDRWTEHAVDDLRSPEGFVEACVVEVPDALPDDTWTHVALVGDGTAER